MDDALYDARNRAEALNSDEKFMDAMRHYDAFKVEEMIAVAIREAVLAERERCAVIAEIAATHTLGDPCRIIAQRIRIDPAKG